MLDVDFIETHENVLLQRRLAGIGTRFVAGLIDSLIIAGVYITLGIIVLVLLFGGVIQNLLFAFQSGIWLLAILILVVFLIYWGYFVFFEMVMNGQTPGKRSQRIRVVKCEGDAIRFVDVAIRNLLRAVDGIGVYAVAGLFMFFGKKCQRLGDFAAGTIIISEAVDDYSTTPKKRGTSSQGQPQQATAEALAATNLSPEEYNALSNYASRRHGFELDARQRLLTVLCLPILKRVYALKGDETLAVLERCVDDLMARASQAERSAEPPHGMGDQQ